MSAPLRKHRRHHGNIEGETIIGRPPEVVFDFVAYERNEPMYNPHMIWAELISGGALGLGSQFRAATKSKGRALEMTIEWAAYERPSRLESTTRMQSADIHGALTFAPRAEGTLMRWSWDVESLGVFKLLTPMIARVGKRQEEAIWGNLKRYLEASEAATE